MTIDRHHRALARKQARAFAKAARAKQIPVVPWLIAEERRLDRTWRLETLSSTSWWVKPGGYYGWFYILFAPGVVVLAGDAGDLRLEHYNAMPTLAAALRWLHGRGDNDYLLGKSSARRKLDRGATARFLLNTARDELKGLGGRARRADDTMLAKIRDRIGTEPSEAAIEADLCDRMDHEVAEFCRDLGFSDYYGSQSWDENDRRLLRLILLWAELMRRQRAVGITLEELAA